MNASGNPSQDHGNIRCGRVAMNVAQRFLNNAQERPLLLERQSVDLCARTKFDGDS
jgi:hypothetical protein